MKIPNRIPASGWIAAAFALVLGACGGMGQRSQAPATYIIVQNNLVPSTTVAIYASPSGGVQREVGTVPPSTTDTLRFNPLGGSGPYQFVAQVVGGQAFVRNQSVVTPGSRLEWNLSANVLTLFEPD